MDKKYEVLKLENQLCFPMYLCAKEIQRRYTPFLDAINLTYTQYVVMMYFWEQHPYAAAEKAGGKGLSHANAQ